MITGSVTPYAIALKNDWSACKGRLFEKLVETSPVEDLNLIPAREGCSPRDALTGNAVRVNEISSAVFEVISFFDKYSLFSKSYVDNLKQHFEKNAENLSYAKELLRDFEFKSVKKLNSLTDIDHFKLIDEFAFNHSPSLKAQETLVQAVIQLKLIQSRCVNRVKDITYDQEHGARTLDTYGKDFWLSNAEHGHCLELKTGEAPDHLAWCWSQGEGPLGPDTHTTIISKKKLSRLLENREILVISRSKTSGKREICKATLPRLYFNEFVESRHLYRGMENYPLITVDCEQGKLQTSAYSIIGNESEPVKI